MTSSIDLNKAPYKDERADLVFLARVAESAERFDDMCAFMKRIAQTKGWSLTEDERNLLSVAFKNAIGSRRAAWRTLHAEEYKGNELIKFYEDFIEPEFTGLCNDVLALLDNYLIPSATGGTPGVELIFYRKMAGDYARYLAEFRPDGVYATRADEYYGKAWEDVKVLSTTNPIRLGLALNYSVCYYEVLKQPQRAITLAREAFDQALAHLDTLDNENDYKDTTAIMQLIRDNLQLWSGGQEEAAARVDGEATAGGDAQPVAAAAEAPAAAETAAAAAEPVAVTPAADAAAAPEAAKPADESAPAAS